MVDSRVSNGAVTRPLGGYSSRRLGSSGFRIDNPDPTTLAAALPRPYLYGGRDPEAYAKILGNSVP
jgi:hypothetical protein